MTADHHDRVILIAVSGLDWQMFSNGVRRGITPALGRLSARGIAAPLRPASPLSRLAAFADIATGWLVERHGVYHAEEGWAGGTRPTGHASWLTQPAWERLAQADIATAVVNWPATGPGAEWQAQIVDPDYPTPVGADPDRWPMPPDCVPLPLRSVLRDARVHPADLGGEMLLPILPDLATIEQPHDRRPLQVATAMARAATVQAAAVHLLETGTRALFVHHDWLDIIRAADLRPNTIDADGALRFLDRLVEGLISVIGDDATVLFVSPGIGVHGVFVARGGASGTVISRTVVGTEDIVPTIFAAVGFAAPDMPGTSLITTNIVTNLAASALPVAPHPSPAGLQVSKWILLAEMIVARDSAQALRLIAAALDLAPDHPGALSVAAAAHVALGEPDPLTAIGDALERVAPDRHWAAMVRGIEQAMRRDAAAARPWLETAFASGDGATLLRVGGAWLMLDRPREAERAFSAALSYPDQADAARLGVAAAVRAAGEPARAEAPLRALIASQPANATGWLQLAEVLKQLGRTREASRAREVGKRYSGTPQNG